MGIWIALAGAACLVVIVVALIAVYVAGLRTRMAILGGTCMASTGGAAIGLLAVYIAIQHNPQGAYVGHETGVVNYFDLSAMFLSAFAIVSLVASFALALAAWAVRGLRVLYRLLRA